MPYYQSRKRKTDNSCMSVTPRRRIEGVGELVGVGAESAVSITRDRPMPAAVLKPYLNVESSPPGACYPAVYCETTDLQQQGGATAHQHRNISSTAPLLDLMAVGITTQPPNMTQST